MGMIPSCRESNKMFSFCDFLLQKAVERGAVGVREPWEETDENGTVVFATVKTVITLFIDGKNS